MKKLLSILLLGTTAAACAPDPYYAGDPYNDPYYGTRAYTTTTVDPYPRRVYTTPVAVADPYYPNRVYTETTVYYYDPVYSKWVSDVDWRARWREDAYHRSWQDNAGVWHYSYYDTRANRWYPVDSRYDMYGRRTDTAAGQREERHDREHGRSVYNRPTNFSYNRAYDQY